MVIGQAVRHADEDLSLIDQAYFGHETPQDHHHRFPQLTLSGFSWDRNRLLIVGNFTACKGR
jgi:hypothetical protein